jgi:hypothetical protein
VFISNYALKCPDSDTRGIESGIKALRHTRREQALKAGRGFNHVMFDYYAEAYKPIAQHMVKKRMEFLADPKSDEWPFGVFADE